MRHAGPLLFALALLALAGLRWDASRRAGALLDNEARARATLRELHAAAAESIAAGRDPASLAETLLGAGRLARLPELDGNGVRYAGDGDYLYGFAPRVQLEAGAPDRPGFVLRAWPADFGRTGDVELHLGDDGRLWEAQNRNGRSGTEAGFPPPFPAPDLERAGSPWRRVPDVPDLPQR